MSICGTFRGMTSGLRETRPAWQQPIKKLRQRFCPISALTEVIRLGNSKPLPGFLEVRAELGLKK